MGVVSEESVRKCLNEALKPSHLEITDFSDGCGNKYNILVVSEKFDGLSTLESHRLVQKALGDKFDHIHALSINTYTLEKWKNKSK
ncbi:unnamed protein product [Dracunculus medinensis]|uniref:BolA-like protein n=1 Tax=Dracunculus medinensis TaxID=318479 RepID=A0A0N4U231_DRAME|nr:unnamed protein product [Dracunculus medinensis]